MAQIKAFRMVHYNGESAGQLEKVITPPYDIISPAEQHAFYESHPLNIIRLVLGKEYRDDGQEHNRYTRAAATLNQWMTQGVLLRSDRPGMVVYQMEFDEPGCGRLKLDGLVALVKVDEYGRGKVLPHEKTYKGPKQDQLNLLRACRANLTPIHALFHDEEEMVNMAYKSVLEASPEQEAVDPQGTIHRTWTLSDEDQVEAIVRAMADKTIFIADGHHRYETSMAYRREALAGSTSVPEEVSEYVMMYLTSMSHPGLVIRPAHRMLKDLPRVNSLEIVRRLAPYFVVEELFCTDEQRNHTTQDVVDKIGEEALIGGRFGMLVHGDDCIRLFKLNNFHAVDHLIDPSMPKALRNLDVSILRDVIIGYGVGVDNENIEGHIEYTPDPGEALEKVRRGEVQIAFIINSTPVEQVRRAAELGHKLPHKSTYFHPKIASGLVLNVG